MSGVFPTLPTSVPVNAYMYLQNSTNFNQRPTQLCGVDQHENLATMEHFPAAPPGIPTHGVWNQGIQVRRQLRLLEASFPLHHFLNCWHLQSSTEQQRGYCWPWRSWLQEQSGCWVGLRVSVQSASLCVQQSGLHSTDALCKAYMQQRQSKVYTERLQSASVNQHPNPPNP